MTRRPSILAARRRLQARGAAILQTAVAALVAWYLAALLLPDPRPVFASIAAIIAIGASHGEHRQRALQLVGGVVLGLSISDLLIHAIGTGAPQVAVLVVLAMSAAVLLGGGELLISEAAVSAILLVALAPGTGAGYSPNRILEAVIGGVVALAAGALLFPPDPALQVGRAAQAVFGDLGRALERIAGALAAADTGRAEQALADARGIDALVEVLDEALASGRETAHTAPQRFVARETLERYERSLPQLDLAVRNTRVLARHTLRSVRSGQCAPEELSTAISELSLAVWALAAAYDDPERAWEARRLAVGAAARATALQDGADLLLTEILAQVRSTAVDLTRAAEQVAGSPELLPTEELLALPHRSADDAHVDLRQRA
jgi:uncharacterized membrane protein YgaE (UPF0421/DUF939 family)